MSRAKELSLFFRSSSQAHPLDTAVFHTEFVMRHPVAAKAMRSPLARLNWFESLLLDVFAFYLGQIVLVIILGVKAAETIILQCSSASQTKKA